MPNKPEEAIANNPATGEIFLPNDLEELKSKSGKKGSKGLNIATNTWKDKKEPVDSETSEADNDDIIDLEWLKDKRREELLVYEQVLFGERPDLFETDPNNPKAFYKYDLEGNISNDFGKSNQSC